MELVRRGAVALWRQIGEILKREIETGVFLPGNRMSTEHELTARFSVTRHTVRRAIADLEEQGLVRVTHGSGIYVQERVIDYNVTRRTRFSANLAQQSIASGAIMLSSGESEADQEMAEALEIPLGEPLVFMEVAGEADGRRITCSINYFPRKRFSGIIEAYRDTRSITAALKQCGGERLSAEEIPGSGQNAFAPGGRNPGHPEKQAGPGHQKRQHRPGSRPDPIQYLLLCRRLGSTRIRTLKSACRGFARPAACFSGIFRQIQKRSGCGNPGSRRTVVRDSSPTSGSPAALPEPPGENVPSRGAPVRRP